MVYTHVLHHSIAVFLLTFESTLRLKELKGVGQN